jgi:nitrate reductase assembly molybdenum cofactor insertion protein NarJ
VRELLREAARWHLLARLFECPSKSWCQQVGQLANEVDDADLKEAAAAALVNASEGDYHSVFGPGGPAPPREVSYRDSLELGSLMSEVTGAYAAFGYAPVTTEAPDHVAVEAGFIAYLHFKEAYAVASGDTERAQVTRQAMEQFRSQHVAVIGAPLAAVLGDSEIDYLARASQLLARRAGRPPARTRLPVIQTPADEEGGSEFLCGGHSGS